MSAIQGLYAETVSDTTASGTGNWVDCASISAGSFTGSAKYLIIAVAEIHSSSSTAENHVRLVHGTTPTEFDDSDAVFDSGSGANGSQIFSWMYVWTQPSTAELIKIQIQGEGAVTATCSLSQIFALNLDDFGTLNTDYYYTEDLTDYSTTTTPTAKASVTFTPNGTDAWLIIGNASVLEAGTVSNGNAAGFEIHDSVGGTTNPASLFESEDADAGDEARIVCGMRVFVPSAASHTFSVRPYHIGSSAFTVASTRIVALNLNKFAQFAHAYTDGSASLATAPSWTNAATVNFTPSLTGNWFYWGQLISTVTSLGDAIVFRLQDDNDGSMGSDPAFGDDLPGICGWDSADLIAAGLMKMKSLSSGTSTTINIDGSATSGGGAVQARSIVAFALETAASGTQYEQSASGGITPSGAISKQDSKVLTGSNTPSGTIAKLTTKDFSGGLSSITGALLKQAEKVLSGDLSSIVGTLSTNRGYTRSFDGTLSPAGDFEKLSNKVLEGTLTTSGALLKFVTKLFSGDLIPGGSLTKETQKSFEGSLSPAGPFTGNAQLLVMKAFTGDISPTGAITKETSKSFSGSITPTGNILKITDKILAGGLTLSGILETVKTFVKSLDGTLSPSGQLQNETQKPLSGTLTSDGTLLKTTEKTLTGDITPSGALIKLVSKILAGILSLTGDLGTLYIPGGGDTFFQDVDGGITPTGSLVKDTLKILTGDLSTSGAISRDVSKFIEGALSPTGSPEKSTTKTFSGDLTSLGGVTKQTNINLLGDFTSSGSLSFIKLFAIMLSGGMTLAGTLVRDTFKDLAGSISPVGTLNKLITRTLSGVLNFIGTLAALGGVIQVVSKVYLLGSRELTVRFQGLRRRVLGLIGSKSTSVDLEGSREELE